MDINTRIDEIVLKQCSKVPLRLFIKRDDLMHEHVSGNKWYKLRFNLQSMKAEGKDAVLTFGGAFSNHIAATAALCSQANIPCIGIIRGEASSAGNPTLQFAQSQGMQLRFVSRSEYRKKEDEQYLGQLQSEFPKALIIPEGGANDAGIEGASLMYTAACAQFEHLHVAVGTATTLAGICTAMGRAQQAHAHIIHKHIGIVEALHKTHAGFGQVSWSQIHVCEGDHLGGYAKWNNELLNFARAFYNESGIKLDPIYTAKAMWSLVKQLEQSANLRVHDHLFFHTGGVQGIAGFEAMNGIQLYD